MPESKKDLLKRLRDYVDEGAPLIGKIHRRFANNMKFVSGVGDQWDRKDRKRFDDSRLPALNMNELHKSIEQISGKESTARFEPRCIDRTEESGPLCEAANEFIRATRADCAAESEESDAFRDLCIGAYGWLDVPTDLRGRMPFTEILNIPGYEMLWDPTCRRRGLQDRQWHIRGKWVGRQKFASLWPEHADLFDEIMEDNTFDWGMEQTQESSRVPWLDFNKGRFWDSKKESVFYIEAEYKDAERYYEVDLPYEVFAAVEFQANGNPQPGPRILTEEDIDDLSPFGVEERAVDEAVADVLRQAIASPAVPEVDPTTGQTVTLPPVPIDLDEGYFELLQNDLVRAGIKFYHVERDVYRWAFAAGPRVLDSGRRPENYWTMLCMTGFGEKQQDKTVFYSPVDVSKDHQRWTNKAYSLMIEILGKHAKGAWMAERGRIKNASDVARKLARPGAVIEVDSVENPPIKALEASTSGIREANEFFNIAKTAVAEQMGLNAAATGSVGGDLRRISGEVVQSLQQTAQVTLAGLFTSLEQLRRELGKLLILKMHTYYTRGDLARVIGGRKAASLPESRHQWKGLLSLQVTVDQVPTTPTENQHTLEMLTNTALAQVLIQGGYLPPQYLIKLLPFPATDKQEILAHIESMQRAEEEQQPPPAPPPA